MAKTIDQTKLKVSVVSNYDTNKTIEELLYKCIAKYLYNKSDFKENLLLATEVS